MIEKIKELRVNIDGVSQLVVEVTNSSETGYYLLHTRDSLIMAKGWLGKLLGELGDGTPYSAGKKEVKDIEPAADVANAPKIGSSFEEDWSSKNNIEKLDLLRTNIEELSDEVKYLGNDRGFEKGISYHPVLDTREKNICRTNTWTHLCEAKMWLGLELGRIRDEK